MNTLNQIVKSRAAARARPRARVWDATSQWQGGAVSVKHPTCEVTMNLIDAIVTEATVQQKVVEIPRPVRKFKKPSIASICRDMIELGATDAAIHEVLLSHGDQLKYTKEKFGYIAWYRSYFKRQVKLAAKG